MTHDSSLLPAILYKRPIDQRFRDDYRRWQGIPSIEVTDKGRNFCQFLFWTRCRSRWKYYGFCVSAIDGGDTFRSCEAVAEHPDPECRIYDPCLWIDPHNVLWMTWTQAKGFNDGRSGVWVSTCQEPRCRISHLDSTAPHRQRNHDE